MFEPWFAQPEFLWTLLAVPGVLVFFVYAWLRRRRALMQLGSSLLLRRSILLKPRLRRWKRCCLLTALILLGLACARPQWGHDPTPLHRAGRDVILVLDLSRSMHAEQPSRRDLALRSLRRLADAFEQNGGNRIALVVFAARAKLLFPLTQDYDHLRHTLAQIETDDYPPLSAEDGVSGTRIGAALKAAVDNCEPERANRPVIVLLSDGDDPAGDEEWLQGVTEAKKKQLRVHTVGFGDPNQGHTIPVRTADGIIDRLQYEGQPVRTKLNEERLREIAARTGGVYLPAHTQDLPLGIFVQHLLDADAWREEDAADSPLAVFEQRYAWFLLPAVLLLMLTMLLNEGPISAWRWPWRFPMRIFSSPEPKHGQVSPPRLPALALTVAALLSLSAGPAPPVEALVRDANEAFARQDYEAAEKLYEQAEALTLDPGLVAFNKAAACYRQKKYREAIECYRRCLDDDQAPAPRRGRAWFDLGNALMQQAGDDPNLLAQATAAYRACLRQPDLPAALRADARHNLEVAQVILLRTPLAQQQKDNGSKKEDSSPPKNPPEDRNSLDKATDPGGEEPSPATGDPRKGPKPGQAAPTHVPKKSRTVASGTVQVLPEQDLPLPITAENTLATLEDHAQRIARLRRQHNNPVGPATIATKDW